MSGCLRGGEGITRPTEVVCDIVDLVLRGIGIVEYRTVYLAGGEPDKSHHFDIEQCGLDTVCIDSLVRAVIDEKLADYGIKAECALDTNCLLAWRDSMTASADSARPKRRTV